MAYAPRPSVHLVAGGCAGFLATALLHPLDLIKTRLHVQEQWVRGAVRRLPFYTGLWDACRSIMKVEGVAGFYGGLAPNMVGNTASWAVYMYAYNRCKTSLAESSAKFKGTSLYLTAATIAGAITTMLLHPVFMIKTRMQLQLRTDGPTSASGLPKGLVPMAQRDNYLSSIHALQRMIQEEGMLSIYRGIGPSMLLVSHGSIQFLAYEHAKNHLVSLKAYPTELAGTYDQYGHKIGSSGGSSSSAAPKPPPQLSAYELLLASTGSKVCATLVTYPYQVVRSCMQQRAVVGENALLYQTGSEVVGHIWRADGLAGFYRGIWPHILRSTPQATITLLVYEYLQRGLTAALGPVRRSM